MATKTTFTVPGEPIAQPRQRFSVRNGKIFAYCDGNHPVHDYKNAVRLSAQAADVRPTDGAVGVAVEFWMRRPQDAKGLVYCHRKPDIDNLQKAVMDALKDVAYTDDGRVAFVECAKYYEDGDGPKTVVTVYT